MILLDRISIRHFKALRAVDLVLPPQASVLIEGWNESGKSSLFEAIFFALYGKTLVSEGKNDSAIAYNEKKATVTLAVRIDETLLTITRTLRRDQAALAEVVVSGDGRGTERVTGTSAVNLRILQEMNNLAPDALLNSCFVEQKKLDKLEELSGNQRAEALATLLNLARLDDIQKRLRPTREDERAAERAQELLACADLDAQLPALQARLAGAARRAALATLAQACADLDAAVMHEAALTAERTQLDAAATQLAADHMQSAALAAGAAPLAEVRAHARQIAQLHDTRARLTDEIAQAEADQATLPVLRARLDALRAIADLFAAHDGLAERQRADQAQMQALAATVRDLAQAREDVAYYDTQLAALAQGEPALVAAHAAAQARYAAAVERDALERWLGSSDATSRLREIGEQRAAAEKARDGQAAAMQRHTTLQRGAAHQRLLRGTLAGVVMVLGLELVLTGHLWGALCLLSALALAAWAYPAHAAYIAAAATLQAQQQTLRGAEDAANRLLAQEQIMADPQYGARRRDEAARDLRAQGLLVPADDAAARQRLAALPADATPLPELQAAQATARAQLDGAHQARDLAEHQHAEAQRRLATIAATAGLPAPADDTLAAKQTTLAQTQAQHTRELAALAAEIACQCQAIPVPVDRDAVQVASGGIAQRIQSLTDAAAHASERQHRLAALSDQLQAATMAAEAAWQRFSAAVPDLARPRPDLAEAALAAVTAAYQQRMAQVDAVGVRQRLDHAHVRQGEIKRALDEQAGRIAALRDDIAHLAAAQGIQADPIPTALRAALPELAVLTPEEAASAAQQVRELEIQIASARQRRMEMAAELGIPPEPLDRATCAEEADRLARDLRVREVAVHIAKTTRNHMIQKVLPQTTNNMRLLLPLLTMDRYRDCAITDDFKVQVYDEAAGRMVAKNIFSGGARDQFSLALRLSFALATLPEHLGTTPGFIFLDEPLSSFDRPRSAALVHLLTEGVISRNFRQIFVISHNLMFDRNAFTHHLRLEYGAVVESTLPPA